MFHVGVRLTDITIENPECEIRDSGDTLNSSNTTIIHGYKNSTAQAYAKE